MKDVTAVVLAGGRGGRMGGQDKGLLELCGKPLVQWVTDCIAPQVGTLIVSANRNLGEYKRLGFPVVVDELEGFQGPLAGIAAALKHVKSQHVLVVPADSPRLPPDLCSKLCSALEQSNSEIAVIDYEGRIQPVLMLFRTALQPDIERRLQQGSRKVLEWIESHSYVTVPIAAEGLLMVNINDDESLKAVGEQLCP